MEAATDAKALTISWDYQTYGSYATAFENRACVGHESIVRFQPLPYVARHGRQRLEPSITMQMAF